MSIEQWDKVFAERAWGRWPNTRFVEWAMRRFGGAELHSQVHFVELGSGAGAQLRFLRDEGFHVLGIEGSAAAIAQARGLLIGDAYWVLKHADLADYDGVAPESVECVYDVCTLQHLSPMIVGKVIERAKGWIKPGGYLFSMYAADCVEPAISPGVPVPHFATLRDIFRMFGEPPAIRVASETIMADGKERKHWIVEWQKPTDIG